MIELFEEQLTISAAGFKDFHQALAEIIVRNEGRYWDLYAPTPPEVLVRLEPNRRAGGAGVNK